MEHPNFPEIQLAFFIINVEWKFHVIIQDWFYIIWVRIFFCIVVVTIWSKVVSRKVPLGFVLKAQLLLLVTSIFWWSHYFKNSGLVKWSTKVLKIHDPKRFFILMEKILLHVRNTLLLFSLLITTCPNNFCDTYGAQLYIYRIL